MRQKRAINNLNTLKIAFIFIFFIFVLIIGSFVLRLVTLAKDSLFDEKHRFTVLLQQPNNSKNLLISFAQNNSKIISILDVDGVGQVNRQRLSVLAGIPIDGYVKFVSQKDDKFAQIQDIILLLKQAITHSEISETNLTSIDFVRLWLFAKSVPTYEITRKSYTINNSNDTISDTNLDRLISSLFLDNVISQEKVSIEVVNASGVSGLGNRFARILTNAGGNVIAVSTSSNILPKSIINYADDNSSYTLKFIENLVNIKAMPLKNKTISDIVVTIGKDKAELFNL